MDTTTNDTAVNHCPHRVDRGPATCPRCGAPGLCCFSPSGKGVAACDECQTYWDECPGDCGEGAGG